tara:strand:+ start:423 stop:539 length:117 start_codon:yes stop_codon:yes gene_type:complete
MVVMVAQVHRLQSLALLLQEQAVAAVVLMVQQRLEQAV